MFAAKLAIPALAFRFHFVYLVTFSSPRINISSRSSFAISVTERAAVCARQQRFRQGNDITREEKRWKWCADFLKYVSWHYLIYQDVVNTKIHCRPTASPNALPLVNIWGSVGYETHKSFLFLVGGWSASLKRAQIGRRTPFGCWIWINRLKLLLPTDPREWNGNNGSGMISEGSGVPL